MRLNREEYNKFFPNRDISDGGLQLGLDLCPDSCFYDYDDSTVFLPFIFCTDSALQDVKTQ